MGIISCNYAVNCCQVSGILGCFRKLIYYYCSQVLDIRLVFMICCMNTWHHSLSRSPIGCLKYILRFARVFVFSCRNMSFVSTRLWPTAWVVSGLAIFCQVNCDYNDSYWGLYGGGWSTKLISTSLMFCLCSALPAPVLGFITAVVPTLNTCLQLPGVVNIK